LTSNYQTGVVKEIKLHPLKKMLDAGLNATINTDDPSISQITLSNEYKVAIEDIGISMENLKERILAAAQCSFLLDNEKLKLVEQLGKLLK
jgi:adenosine deaminase